MPKKFEVERILSKKIVNDKPCYLIQWVGFSKKDSTWEPIENLEKFRPMIRRFEKYGTRQSQEAISDSAKQIETKQSKFTILSNECSLQSHSSIEVLPNNDPGILNNNKGSFFFDNNLILDSKLKEQQANKRIDVLMQPFKDDFETLFNDLKKKIKQDFTNQNVQNIHEKVLSKNVSSQTDIILQELEQDKQLQTNIEGKEKNRQNQKERVKEKQRELLREKEKSRDIDQAEEEQQIDSQTQQRKSSQINDYGSFERGNQIETIVKGIEDQSDGKRKYLIQWRQNDNQCKQIIDQQELLKESWVQESVMLEYACKDLAKFFLSRIKWVK